jgi:hypothetical protein
LVELAKTPHETTIFASASECAKGLCFYRNHDDHTIAIFALHNDRMAAKVLRRAAQLFGEFAADSLQIAQTDKCRTTARFSLNAREARQFTVSVIIAGVVP